MTIAEATALIAAVSGLIGAIAGLLGTLISYWNYCEERNKRLKADERALEAEMETTDLEGENEALRDREGNGFTAMVSKHHSDLSALMQPHKGKVMKTAEIRNQINGSRVFKDVADWVLPSDHCRNHTNKGACECAGTERAIFERIKRGLYRVL